MASLLDEAVLAAEPSKSRIAVVVSNGDYVALGTLRNPIADGQLVASSLRTAGFNVTYVRNLSDEQFRATLRQVARDSATAEVTLFYYAGHGAQIGGVNYLLPVDVPLPEQEDDIRLTSVSADDVLSVIKSPYKILVLDACRNNPNLARALSRGRGVSYKRGLAAVTPPAEETGGVFIAYSTQTDAVALDGEGANSPFAESFAQYVGNRVSIDDMFAMVTRDVLKKTNGSQRPFKYASLDTVYCLTGACSSNLPQELAPAATAGPASAGPALAASVREAFAKLNATKSPSARHLIEDGLWQQLRAALPMRVIYGRHVQPDGKTFVWAFEPATAVSDGHRAAATAQVGELKDGAISYYEADSADYGIDCDRHAMGITKTESRGMVKLLTRAEQQAGMNVQDSGTVGIGLVEALCMAPLRLTPLWAVDSLQWVSIGTGYDAAPAIYYRDPSAGDIQDLFVRTTFPAPNINGVQIHYQWLGINCRTKQFEDGHGFGATHDGVILTVFDNNVTWSPFKEASPEANAYVLLCDQPRTGH
jgi:uncharacterized caspase-like protein